MGCFFLTSFLIFKFGRTALHTVRSRSVCLFFFRMGIRRLPFSLEIHQKIKSVVNGCHEFEPKKIKKLLGLMLEVSVLMPFVVQSRCTEKNIQENDAFESFFTEEMTVEEIRQALDYFEMFSRMYDTLLKICFRNKLFASLNDCNYLHCLLVLVNIIVKFNEDVSLAIESTGILPNLIRRHFEKSLCGSEVYNPRYFWALEKFVFKRVQSWLLRVQLSILLMD